MSKIYTCILHARGYELDSFGHVNHAVYIQYLEHARWEMLLSEGITLETFKTWSRWPVIAGIQASYLRPVFLNDRLEVRTRMTSRSRVAFTFEQEIWRESEKVFQAEVTGVMVNEQGKPAAIPEKMEQLITAKESTGTPVVGDE
jgi:acyl-CoA thioester hydrolase